MKGFLSYSSAVAHGKSAKKVETKRAAMIQSVQDARKKVAAMPAWQGDKNLKDSTAKFFKTTFHILNDDYGKIVNMEEIAEQSYDAMEAYLLAQDVAHDKLHEADRYLQEEVKRFAAANNINLIEGEGDAIALKLKTANEVNQYYRVIYLIFFKSNKQEAYMIDAINKKNVNAVEQNRSTLLKYSEEGLAKLKNLQPYNGDRSLIDACRQMLEFYKQEAEKIPAMTDYFIQEENYHKVKKAYDAKKPAARTSGDVDQYNAAVNDMNTSSKNYNDVNNALNTNRSKLIDNYNKAVAKFMDKHVPRYK